MTVHYSHSDTKSKFVCHLICGCSSAGSVGLRQGGPNTPARNFQITGSQKQERHCGLMLGPVGLSGYSILLTTSSW